jgi:hypothetical protein
LTDPIDPRDPVLIPKGGISRDPQLFTNVEMDLLTKKVTPRTFPFFPRQLSVKWTRN